MRLSYTSMRRCCNNLVFIENEGLIELICTLRILFRYLSSSSLSGGTALWCSMFNSSSLCNRLLLCFDLLLLLAIVRGFKYALEVLMRRQFSIWTSFTWIQSLPMWIELPVRWCHVLSISWRCTLIYWFSAAEDSPNPWRYRSIRLLLITLMQSKLILDHTLQV